MAAYTTVDAVGGTVTVTETWASSSGFSSLALKRNHPEATLYAREATRCCVHSLLCSVPTTDMFSLGVIDSAMGVWFEPRAAKSYWKDPFTVGEPEEVRDA